MAYELLEEEQSHENSSLDYGKEFGRHIGRTASNLSTQAVGLPGDIFSLVNEFIAKPAAEAITGEKGVPYEETFLGKALPTTETHRKRLEGASEGFLKPQNKVEQFVGDVVDDTAMLMNPVTAAKTGIKLGSKLFKSLAKSLGANVAGESVKQVARDETSGNLTKAGSLFLLSLMDQESAAKQVGKLYSVAESNLPANAKTNAGGLSKQLDSLDNKITKSRPKVNLSAPEKFVVDQTDKIRNLIQNGEISVEQAIAQKRSLNKELSTLYKEVPKHSDQKTVKNMAKQINGFLNKTIEDYGRTNPKFYKPYKDADQAFGTLARSNFISQWVDNNVVQHPLTTGLLHLFGPIGTSAAVAVAPYQAAKLTYRISKSPTLAKIYGQAVKAAAKEDAVLFNKYLKNLDAEIQKEESKDKYEFID